MAKLVPLGPRRAPRRLGLWAGKGWIAPDFDQMPEDLVKLFKGGE